MNKITFLPDNRTFEFSENNTILELAYKNSIEIPSDCEMGTCYTCMVYIEKGSEYLFENSGFENNSKNMLSCITELKSNIQDSEVIVKIG